MKDINFLYIIIVLGIAQVSTVALAAQPLRPETQENIPAMRNHGAEIAIIACRFNR